MQKTDSVIAYDFNPTFLYTWKGVRTKDEERYHCHEHVELAFIMSGKGRYKTSDILITSDKTSRDNIGTDAY